MRNRNTKLQLVSLPSTEFYFFKHVFSSHSFIVFLLAGVYCLSRKFFFQNRLFQQLKHFLALHVHCTVPLNYFIVL